MLLHKFPRLLLQHSYYKLFRPSSVFLNHGVATNLCVASFFLMYPQIVQFLIFELFYTNVLLQNGNNKAFVYICDTFDGSPIFYC